MKHNKVFESISFTAITATIFIAFFLVYLNVLQSMINVLITDLGAGLQHYR